MTAAQLYEQYRADYNNRPSNSISFMTDVTSTSGHLRVHCELVCLLCFQIRKQTVFLQVQDFTMRNPTSSITVAWCSPHHTLKPLVS